jgi:chromate reductase
MKVAAICGSTRKNSTNHRLINAIRELYASELEIILYDRLDSLPHFNPDIEEASMPEQLLEFKQLLRFADGILICTPEYAHGVPGVLKNAIDWTVASCEFSNKPTCLITASTDGKYGHAALIETLRVIEAGSIDELELLIPFAQTKISREGRITDEKTAGEVQSLIRGFIKLMNEKFPDRMAI